MHQLLRKAVSAVAGTMFILVTMQTGFAASVVSSTDIQASADFLKQAGIIQGDEGTGALRLDDNINRAELMKIVVAAATNGAADSEFHDCFPDVKKEWYSRYICWASSNKYVGGYPDGNFAAAKNVNTAEAIKIISEVFHLDFASSAAQADKNVWYDIYIKNAAKQGIVDGTLSAEVLGRSATRGEVFNYLYRAMLLSDKREDTFKKDAFEGFRAEDLKERMAEREAREFTKAEAALMSVLRAHMQRGYADMSSSGELDFTLSLPKDNAEPIELDVHLTKQVKTDSDAKGLDRMSADVQFDIDVKGFSGEKVAGTVTGDASLMMDGTMYYMRINSISASNIVAAKQEVKFAMEATVSSIQASAGKWFSIDKRTVDSELTIFKFLNGNKMMPGAAVGFLEKIMKSKASAYLTVSMPNADDESVLNIGLNTERFPLLIENVLLAKSPNANRYALRRVLKPMDTELKALASKFAVTLTYDTTDKLMRSMELVLGKSTVTNAAGGKVSVSVSDTSEFAYGSEQITPPTGAIVLKYIPILMKYRE